MSVSVCMATHNGEAFLRQQIESVLSQLKEEDELIISDDQSTDRTMEILRSYQSSNVRILPPKKFGNPINNFEYTLTECRNEIIFLADQDDYWYANKISLMGEALLVCDLAVCDCRVVDENLNLRIPSFFQYNRSRQGLFRNLLKSSFVGCCMAFNRKVLSKALPFPEKISMHDQWIGLISQKYFNVKFIPQILVDHRRHGNNYSTMGEASRNSFRKKVFSRLQLAKMLVQR
jgi:glycosyltransferase involved in cell wall biosynthesis